MSIGRREAAGVRPHPLSAYWVEIGAILGLKLAALALLYVFFFAPAHRPAMTPQSIANHLLAAPSAPRSEVDHDR